MNQQPQMGQRGGGVEEAGSHGRQSPTVGITAEGRNLGEKGHPRSQDAYPSWKTGTPGWNRQVSILLSSPWKV